MDAWRFTIGVDIEPARLGSLQLVSVPSWLGSFGEAATDEGWADGEEEEEGPRTRGATVRPARCGPWSPVVAGCVSLSHSRSCSPVRVWVVAAAPVFLTVCVPLLCELGILGFVYSRK